MVWISVNNNSCSSCISHEVTSMWSVIKLLYCKSSIYYVDSQTPYFDMFLWRSCSMTEEVSNITTQPILILTGDTYGILIGRPQNLFIVTSVYYNRSFYISKCLIKVLTFTIERIYISTCSLDYAVHVMTCNHEFRRSFWWYIFINSD